jgi:hypothetical protein
MPAPSTPSSLATITPDTKVENTVDKPATAEYIDIFANETAILSSVSFAVGNKN